MCWPFLASDALLDQRQEHGLGVEDVLEAVVARIPPPKGTAEAPLQALIFDSWFDPFRGAVVLVRVMNGRIAKHMKIRLCFNDQVYEVEALGALTPKPVVLEELVAGDVGFIIANIKQVADARVGDTVIDPARPAPALPGFEAIKPMVFAGLFPVLASDYENLRDALGKLQLNDAAFFYEPENSRGPGIRISLRISWVSLHLEHCPGAPGTRVRHQPDYDGSQRALPHYHHRRRRRRSGQPHEISTAQ